MTLLAAKVGIFFGTSTGNTENIADQIALEFGSDVADGPFDIDLIQGDQGGVSNAFGKYDALVVGTPTWNTGADTERSGTGWDDIYYGDEMQGLDMVGKNVAVFGLGDSISYTENYADASGELHDVFKSLGCNMIGYTSQEGYEHEDSKAIRGDKFCGLLLDEVNQDDMSHDRITSWVKQLKAEHQILQQNNDNKEGGGGSSSSSTVIPSSSVEGSSIMVSSFAEETIQRLGKENAELRKVLEEQSRLIGEEKRNNASSEEEEQQQSDTDGNGYTPHHNAWTGRTMWTSPDGRSCYYTTSSSNSHVDVS